MTDAAREEAIRRVIEDYVLGANLGPTERLARVLHPRFQTAGYFKGSETWLDRDAALEMVQAQEVDASAVPEWSIPSLTIVGDTAVARVISLWDGAQFDELLSFLFDGTHWRIVFKTFHIPG